MDGQEEARANLVEHCRREIAEGVRDAYAVAARFLIIALGGQGDLPVSECLGFLREVGVSGSVIRRARRDWGITSYREGGQWMWRIPREGEDGDELEALLDELEPETIQPAAL